jgi:excisionase family DNA binding protein
MSGAEPRDHRMVSGRTRLDVVRPEPTTPLPVVPGASLGALRIPEVCRLTGFGRTTIYAAIKTGDLVARRYGRRTIVLEEDLQKFLRNLPTI